MTGYKLILPAQNLTSYDSGDNARDAKIIKGVIFDMDGTLTKPQTWMFGEMRKQVGVPDGVDILEHIESLHSIEETQVAEDKLKAIEEKAMREQEPTPGLLYAFKKLHDLKIKTSICTRNLPQPVTDFCLKFLNHSNPFDQDNKDEKLISGPIVTREFKPPKPSAEPILHICNSWGVDPSEVVMVGDSIDDMQAGFNAGCAVVLLRHEDNQQVCSQAHIDDTITDLYELIDKLQNGILVYRNI
ncbi:hypothetical protein CANINC_001392 [Pichia inconspicua]|uniref:HAD-like protein n=1 Tax=Pichia inconspicua TaxID=52247 RepID=A0A4T0X464_9ASCO|nr:hypothetical protein CANINC_001392 [[Candida] inconspicua]